MSYFGNKEALQKPKFLSAKDKRCNMLYMARRNTDRENISAETLVSNKAILHKK